MGLWVPPVSWDGYESNITTPVIGTTVTADAVANTKNATYTQLIASTAFDAHAIYIHLSDVSQSTLATGMLVDIAIGAVASETVIIPNLQAGAATSFGNFGGVAYWFPLYIPASSRLSATCQATIGGDTVNVTVKLWGNPSSPVWAGTEVIDYGTTLATSSGTSVAAGLSSAEGAYTQITASTTRTHHYIGAGLSVDLDTGTVAHKGMLDVGVGAATEDTILEDMAFGSTTSEEIQYMQPMGGFVQVPAASRLAARISASAAGAQSFDVILYGVG